MLKRFIDMAHPASERTLSATETSVICSALASYQRECMQEAKGQRTASLYSASVRRSAEAVWSARADIAHDIYESILPITPGPTPKIRIVR